MFLQLYAIIIIFVCKTRLAIPYCNWWCDQWDNRDFRSEMDRYDKNWFKNVIEPVLEKVHFHEKTPKEMGLRGKDAYKYRY